MGIPQVMHEAMKSFAPTSANKNAAIAAAVKAGERFLAQYQTVDEETKQQLRSAALEVWFLYCRLVASTLLPEAVRLQLPPLNSQEEEPDPLVVCKFFTPDSDWTWYAVEFDGLDSFIGYVVGHVAELGSFTLHELEEARGPLGAKIERDEQFAPTRLSEIKKLHESHQSLPIIIVIETMDTKEANGKNDDYC